MTDRRAVAQRHISHARAQRTAGRRTSRLRTPSAEHVRGRQPATAALCEASYDRVVVAVPRRCIALSSTTARTWRQVAPTTTADTCGRCVAAAPAGGPCRRTRTSSYHLFRTTRGTVAARTAVSPVHGANQRQFTV